MPPRYLLKGLVGTERGLFVGIFMVMVMVMVMVVAMVVPMMPRGPSWVKASGGEQFTSQ